MMNDSNQSPEDVARKWLLEIFDTKHSAFAPVICVTEEQSEDLFSRLAACQQESPSAVEVFDDWFANRPKDEWLRGRHFDDLRAKLAALGGGEQVEGFGKGDGKLSSESEPTSLPAASPAAPRASRITKTESRKMPKPIDEQTTWAEHLAQKNCPLCGNRPEQFRADGTCPGTAEQACHYRTERYGDGSHVCDCQRLIVEPVRETLARRLEAVLREDPLTRHIGAEARAMLARDLAEVL